MSYFLTSIAYYPEHDRYKNATDHTRTFGHFATLAEAEAAVKENRCDMIECLYSHLVIEEIGYGIHALGDNQWWYEERDNAWHPIDKPNWAKPFVNWAIG